MSQQEADVLGLSLRQLWELGGSPRVTYLCPEEGEVSLELPGIEVGSLSREDIPPEPFALKYVCANTALLFVDSVPRAIEERYFQFLKEAFENIQERGIQNLVIDMRTNGGGSTYQFNELYNYISDTPYRTYSRIDVRLSNRYINRFFPWYLQHFQRLRNFLRGSDIYTTEPELRTPPEISSRFQGQVYLLVGPGTLSSAKAFAAQCQDYDAAIIVGHETGGLASSYGDSYKFFVRLSGEITNKGVIPDWQMDVGKDYENLMEKIKDR